MRHLKEYYKISWWDALNFQKFLVPTYYHPYRYTYMNPVKDSAERGIVFIKYRFFIVFGIPNKFRKKIG